MPRRRNRPKKTRATSRSESFLDGRVKLIRNDMRRALARLPANSLDACVTDPPYHLTSIVKRYGKPGSKPAKIKETGVFRRHTTGFAGQKWDGGSIAFELETWRLVYEALKPGAWLVAFAGTRGAHNMATAIEAAGFEIRDSLAWIYGQGFPKSLNVAVEFEKQLCRQRNGRWYYRSDGKRMARQSPWRSRGAVIFSGYGSGLKPAIEPIVMARKPFRGTLLGNLRRWGTGALNIDGCRVAAHLEKWNRGPLVKRLSGGNFIGGKGLVPRLKQGGDGRWPSNVLLDGSGEVLAEFPTTPASRAAPRGGGNPNPMSWGKDRADKAEPRGHNDAGGSASRLFYSAKADHGDRFGSDHPTVKPLDLIEYLCRLVAPPNPQAVILDPFAGTGTTGEAAWRLGLRALLIEREQKYARHIRRRMRWASVRRGAAGK